MRRELLLLREMRDAALAIRELVAGRSTEQVEADDMRRRDPRLHGMRRPPADDRAVGIVDAVRLAYDNLRHSSLMHPSS